jgi:SAM-dependent methyltransferase
MVTPLICVFNAFKNFISLALFSSFIKKNRQIARDRQRASSTKMPSGELFQMTLFFSHAIVIAMKIKIQNDAVKYILFQRTVYLILQNNIFINRFLIRMPTFLPYNRVVRLEAALFKNRTRRLFNEDMAKEYETIKNYLPSHINSVLDIGCGVAGIDVLIYSHYKERHKNINLFLLDKTELNDKVYYGLEKQAAYYNSLDVAKSLLIENGVEANAIHLQEVTDNARIFPGEKFGLIISLISWGFHYPVETYLDQAYDLLEPNGVLIIDIRKRSGEEQLIEIKNKFKNVEIIYEAPKQKHRRIVAIKKAS